MFMRRFFILFLLLPIALYASNDGAEKLLDTFCTEFCIGF